MSEDYYRELPSLKVDFNENGNEKSKIFHRCEWVNSGDFAIIFQFKLKSVIPLVQISSIEYPYETND